MAKIQFDKKPTIKALVEALDGDLDLSLFFVSWIKNGQNATKAYQELHPEIDYASAAVLGSRMLKKVNIESVLSIYGLSAEKYLTMLKEGLEANRTISTISGKDANSGTVDFVDVPDHQTRKAYHDKLGKLLGLEAASNSVLNIDNRQQTINITPNQEQIDAGVLAELRERKHLWEEVRRIIE